jgi:hypothetical protein
VCRGSSVSLLLLFQSGSYTTRFGVRTPEQYYSSSYSIWCMPLVLNSTGIDARWHATKCEGKCMADRSPVARRRSTWISIGNSGASGLPVVFDSIHRSICSIPYSSPPCPLPTTTSSANSLLSTGNGIVACDVTYHHVLFPVRLGHGHGRRRSSRRRPATVKMLAGPYRRRDKLIYRVSEERAGEHVRIPLRVPKRTTN